MSKAMLTWVNPTTRIAAGTPPVSAPLDPSEIAEVDVLDGSTIAGTVMGAGTTLTTGVLTTGMHSFTVVVKDTFGQMSAPSNIATVTVTAPLPAPPSPATGLAAVLVD